MSRHLLIIGFVAAITLTFTGIGNVNAADSVMPPPWAPACHSWIPHGYGESMHIMNSMCTRKKVYYGFRTAPQHVGSWGMPLWGWDVNGYYRGPNELEKDPGICQLPIGLIYPENNPPRRQARRIRK